MTLCIYPQIYPQWISAIGDIITGIGTLSLFAIAWWQLSKLNSSNKTSLLMTIIEIESEITKRKVALNDSALELEEYSLQAGISLAKISIMQRRLNSSTEDYLNSIDRLAYCILKNYFPERNWKKEYRNLFNQVVQNFPEKFGLNSTYVNIIDLQEKWRRE